MLGPHFYYDIVRLARKGWPTWLRVLYVVVLLLALVVMYQAAGNVVDYRRPADIANRAQAYAVVLIVLQDLLVLLLMPVYVASAIAEEKEHRTLEPLFLTHLSDRELVLGKFGARLMHLGAVVLAAFPLLALMNLWGNVDAAFLLYHEANTFLLLLTAGSICLWMSAQSETVFQAVSGSFPYMFLLGLFGIPIIFALPWLTGWVIHMAESVFTLRRPTGSFVPWYGPALLPALPAHLVFSGWIIFATVLLMRKVRLEERKTPKKLTGALSLADDHGAVLVDGRKKRVRRSRIHPLALPVSQPAIFWKECLKDGTRWSLTFGWIVIAAGIVLMPALAYRAGTLVFGNPLPDPARSIMVSFSYTSYFIALAAYVLLVLFQTTMVVAGEREQDTLVFLLTVPDDRRTILFYKWLGPLWRNWPVLAISGLGVLLGSVGGIWSWPTTFVLLFLPWPLLLLLSGLGLLFSVLSRRVLYANIGVMGFLALLVLMHVAGSGWIGDVVPFYVSLIFDTPLSEVARIDREWALKVAVVEQGMFLTGALVCLGLAFGRFRRAAM